MSFNPEHIIPPGAKIKVIGVGGGGGNAVNTMISAKLDGVDFITANTDVQSLRLSLAEQKIQLGKELTKGLGAGANPDVGRDAALEDRQEIQEFLTDADMVFITAGMGGGTGTGAAAIISQIARELGALTVAVVTKPFNFEGKRRKKHADLGICRLRECVDTLITIPNQRLLQVADPNTSMMDAFKLVDNILHNAVKSISDIVNVPGTVNVDFADVKTIMASMGQALMGTGIATGESRAQEAARQAISSPLLEDVDIEGATGILINISAGSSITLMEINDACSVVQDAAHEDANIIFGAVIDENLGEEIRVTVIATGFPVDMDEEDSIEALKNQQQLITKTTGLRHLTTHPLAQKPIETFQRPLVEPKPQRPVQQNLTRLTTQEPITTAPIAAEPKATEPIVNETFITAPAQQPIPEPVNQIIEPPVQEEVPPHPAETIQTPEAETEKLNKISSSEEAQELARWTMGLWESPSQEEALEAEEAPVITEETSPATEEIRIQGAVRADEPETIQTQRTFGAQVADFNPMEVEEVEIDQPPLEPFDEGPAPLESFFVNEVSSITTDIDRKIDEALDRADNPSLIEEEKKNLELSEDDLDVPAFLRKEVKDISLD